MKKIAFGLFVLITLVSTSLFACSGRFAGKVSSILECKPRCNHPSNACIEIDENKNRLCYCKGE